MTLNNELNLNSDICFTILGEPKGVVYIINYCGFNVKYLEYNHASIFNTVLCILCLTFWNTLHHIYNPNSSHNSQISNFSYCYISICTQVIFPSCKSPLCVRPRKKPTSTPTQISKFGIQNISASLKPFSDCIQWILKYFLARFHKFNVRLRTKTFSV